LKYLLLLGLIAVLASCGKPAKSEASPGTGMGATPGACRYATDNGCAAANRNGSFQNASLLTSAQRNGQNSLLPRHPMTFNIPGVDYPIGPDKTLTPQDPRAISDRVCKYQATGGPIPWVYCAGTGIIHETLNNIDFCGRKIGKTPVMLYVGGVGGGTQNPALGSTFTITNSYFCIPPAQNTMGWGGGIGANWNIIYKNNQCDGGTANSGSGFCLNDDVDAVGTSVVVEYNVFTNQGVSRVAGGLNYATWTFRYNFVQGLNDLATTSHGELMLRNCGGGARSPCRPSDDYEGNFIVWNPPPASGLNNATVFPGDGSSDAVSLSSFTMKDNIIVTNRSAFGNVINQALFNARLATLGTVTITGNWVDATGADDCSVNGVKAGGNTVTASSSGNTLTVTGLSGSFGNNPIEPGWLILHSGFTTAAITAYGKGGGNLGTYIFGGSPQTVGSDSLWTLVPGYTGTPTLAPNWNLAGSGAPVAMGLNGPQFTATHCSPGY
jgi:hypothetical protein